MPASTPAAVAEPAPPSTVDCPFCEASDAELISLFASQLLTSAYRCRACGSYFEAVREDRWEEALLPPDCASAGGEHHAGTLLDAARAPAEPRVREALA